MNLPYSISLKGVERASAVNQPLVIGIQYFSKACLLSWQFQMLIIHSYMIKIPHRSFPTSFESSEEISSVSLTASCFKISPASFPGKRWSPAIPSVPRTFTTLNSNNHHWAPSVCKECYFYRNIASTKEVRKVWKATVAQRWHTAPAVRMEVPTGKIRLYRWDYTEPREIQSFIPWQVPFSCGHHNLSFQFT